MNTVLFSVVKFCKYLGVCTEQALHCHRSPGWWTACLELAWKCLPSSSPQCGPHTHWGSSLPTWGPRLKGVGSALETPEDGPMKGNGSNHHHLLETHKITSFCRWCLLFPSLHRVLPNLLSIPGCQKSYHLPWHSYVTWCHLCRRSSCLGALGWLEKWCFSILGLAIMKR